MKKIFYFIASAIVALGAVACQNDINEGVTPEQEGFSINVTIADQTRVALGNLDEETKQRKLTFTEGDVLVVREEFQKGTNYFFTYTKGEGDVYTFTCEQEGVNSLVGKTPYVFYLGGLHEQADDLKTYGAFCNTAAENISGIGMSANPTCYSGKFGDKDCTISLETLPVLKFTAQEAVTISSEDNASLFFVNNSWANTYTTTTIGEIYLPVISSGSDCTVTVTTESGFNKSFTETLDWGKIYNLGTIEAPAPAPKYRVYVIAQPKSVQAAWTKVNIYTWDVDPIVAWPGADITNQKETINGYTYNYYEYPETWTGKNVNVIINNNGTAQTSDIALGKLDKNYYVVYNDAGTVYTEAPAAGSIKEVEATLSEWALAGEFNSWVDKVMEVVAGANNLFVAKNVNISAYTEIKVKKVGDWNTSYGGGITYLNANKWMKLSSGGSNIAIVTAGTYDVYFDKANTKLYLMKSGVDYNTAAEQSANGPAPDTSKYTWGVVGNHNGWGNDNVLTWDGTLGLYVAKGVKLNGEFKVRADKTWTTSFGSGGTVTVNNAKATTVYNNGGNCKLSSYSGTYDIYFWYDTTNIKANGKIWVYTAGNAAPTL